MDHGIEDSINLALSSWDRNALEERVDEANALRLEFVQRFPLSNWANLPLERYALGQTVEGGTVCWWLEFHTKRVASMSGGSSNKHLIYRKSTDQTWRFPPTYPSVEVAWNAIRGGFVEMFQLAAEGHFNEIDAIQPLAGANLLRAKATYMYFPEEILPICSREHLDHFLQVLGAPPSEGGAIQTNRQLLEDLRGVPALSGLSTQELGIFVYHWADPRPTAQIFKIAPGEQAKYWSDCLDGGYICLGWDDVGDLSQFADKAEFVETFQSHYPYNGNKSQVTRKSSEVWTLRELNAGDKIVANKGTAEVVAVGTVNDTGYLWRPERIDMRHTVGVDWDTSYAKSIPPVKAWATTTVRKVPHTLYRSITGSAPAAADEPAVGVDDVLREIEEAVERKGQAILYGPPGTGKTYQARRAALWLGLGGSHEPGATAALDDPLLFEAREKELSASGPSSNAVWVMVANPSLWAWKSLFEAQGVRLRPRPAQA